MRIRLSPGSFRLRAVRRVTFWTAMALAAALLISLFVRAQRPPTAPGIAYSNDIHAELAAGAPPKPAAPRVRAPKAPPPAGPSGLKLVPIATDSAIKRVELLDKIPPEEGLMPVNFTAPAAPASAPTRTPEPSLGWGAWNQPAADGVSGPGGIRPIPGLAPTLTASLPIDAAPSAPSRPGTDLPGALPAKASGWHHGHFHGGTLEAHQHGNALHKAHPRSGSR
jgi:hypothetical protein